MSKHIVFNEIDDPEKTRLNSYWKKKLPRLEKLLVHYPPDLREIRLTISRHGADALHGWYEVRAVIHLPTGTLAVEAEDKNPQAALDRVTDKLATEIKRHKERVRHDHIFKRKSRSRRPGAAAGPLLKRDVEKDRNADFFRLLRPHLRFCASNRPGS